jgi:hypothetical protein
MVCLGLEMKEYGELSYLQANSSRYQHHGLWLFSLDRTMLIHGSAGLALNL